VTQFEAGKCPSAELARFRRPLAAKCTEIALWFPPLRFRCHKFTSAAGIPKQHLSEKDGCGILAHVIFPPMPALSCPDFTSRLYFP
jgi:hypothetical protein